MNIFITFLLSFIVCGVFCLLGQIILDNSKFTTGHITSIFVVLGVVLEFLDIYKYIKEISLIGASMPIVSFGSVIMKGVKEGVIDFGLIGVFKGVFNNCGAIIAFSIFLSFISTLFFRPKS